ncbi:MAG TPA: DUF5689 domain-containing protein [Saprospiraceae bacterium]|mgnify:FL=1|nr:DUF5689 domain-containing protein [Saprospiraceae bacterium]HMP22878.1 DUF5689 domain-containing protein [Saprospiraceae bacterium]
MKNVFAVLLLLLAGLLSAQDYPVYTIGQVRGVNAEGVADSLDVPCRLQGIVYGVNLRATGLQFTIIDEVGDGIGVFSGVNTFGYTVQEGDEVIVEGTIDQFNGLTQIIPDTLWRNSENNVLLEPTTVTVLNEDTESRLVRLENLQLVNPTQWTNAGTGFNVTLTNGTDNFTMRIVATTNIFGREVPTGTFSLTGIGGQFDTSSPFTAGYQIFPRYIEDIDPYVPDVPQFPRYAIGAVNTVNAEGRPDSTGVMCELVGIVYAPNFRAGGLQFTIIDEAGDGIGVFNNNNSLGYTVTDGDAIAVQGEISFFNGLTQITASAIEVLSMGNAQVEPRDVTDLDESTESQLVRLRNVSLVDATQWTNSGAAFNVTATDGTRDFTLRISNQTNIFGTPAPAGVFNVVGLGSQFDNSAPFNDGYQLFPRSLADFETVSAVLDPALAQGVKLYPNPVANWLTIESPQGFERIRISNAQGQYVLEWQNMGTLEQLNLTALAPGVYTLTVLREGRLWSLPLVRQ